VIGERHTITKCERTASLRSTSKACTQSRAERWPRESVIQSTKNQASVLFVPPCTPRSEDHPKPGQSQRTKVIRTKMCIAGVLTGASLSHMLYSRKVLVPALRDAVISSNQRHNARRELGLFLAAHDMREILLGALKFLIHGCHGLVATTVSILRSQL
jgi:hypothetical protein